jgi:hypothetical protein
MESYNKHRLSNLEEKVFHDEFIKLFSLNLKTLSVIIYGCSNPAQTIPNEYLKPEEEDICLSIIQWLGSHVGQQFINNCNEEIERIKINEHAL